MRIRDQAVQTWAKPPSPVPHSGDNFRLRPTEDAYEGLRNILELIVLVKLVNMRV
jgi:hypothetical protein